MLAVEVEIPDAYRLISTPHVRSIGCISRTPLTDTPLLGSRYQAEILFDDPLVEVGHFLVLFFCHLGCGNCVAVSIFITHIHLADTNQLSRIRHHCEHTGNSFFQTVERTTVFKIRDVHLCADTINLGHTIILPFLNPVDHRPDFLTGINTIFLCHIPCPLKIIIVDEELDILRTILTGQATSLTHIVQIAHVVLPVEIRTTNIPRTTITLLSILQDIVTLTVIATT